MTLVRWVTNIPTPYRNHRYAVARDLFGDHGLELEVWYQAWTEPDRHWRFTDADIDHPHRVWGGWSPVVSGVAAHINPGLLLALRRRPADVVVVCGWAGPTPILAAAAAGRRPLRLLELEVNPDSSRRSSGAALRVKRSLVERFDGYVVPGPRTADFLRSVSPEVDRRPLLENPNIVDEAVWRDQVAEVRAARRDDIRAELGVSGSLWLTLARLEHRKGLDALIPCLAGAPDITLVVGGTGAQQPELEALARRHGVDVRFLGQVDQERVVELYAAADLFVLPSRRDPNPLSPIEAAAAGLPVLLSTRAGNVDDLVVEGETGWAFDIDHPAAARAAVDAAAASGPQRLAEMGVAAARRHAERFDSRVVVGRFAEQLAALVARGPGSSPPGARR
jgi:glycosyltransferase involved in cell wall biosynthesis